MSFSKSTSKRFVDTGTCAPPVGSYDVSKVAAKGSGPVTFDQGSRFIEKTEQTPGPADIQPSIGVNLNLSSSSMISSCSFATPSKPAKRNAKLKSSSNTDLSCKEMMSQQMHRLQYKIGELEKNLQRTLKDKNDVEKTLKEIRKEKDEILTKLEELQSDGSVSIEELKAELDISQQELSTLKQGNIELESLKKSLEADIELGSQNALALTNQISNLETQKSESFAQIEELESTVWQLQVLLDQVRCEKKFCEEQILKMKAELVENQVLLSEARGLHENGQAVLANVEMELKEQKSQTEAANLSLSALEQTLEVISKDKDSLQDNVFNLERANELLESEMADLSAELLKTKNEKADLEEQMENLENMTTENLRCLTLKYESLENSNDEMKSEFLERENLLTSELEVTKQAHESTLKDLEIMKNTYKSLYLAYDKILAEANEVEDKFEKAENDRLSLKSENEALMKSNEDLASKHEVEKSDLTSELEKLTKQIEEMTNENQRHQIEVPKLKSIIEELEEERDVLFRRFDKMNGNIEKKDEELKRAKDDFESIISMKDASLSKVREELGKRIVETQTKLANAEHNFSRKLEIEESKYAKLLEEHKSFSFQHNNDEVNKEMESWRSKFEDLQSKVRPFQTQLELFEQERLALLSENNVKESEIAKLAENYARILGHQNNKQKIHHIIKIKEENLSLKKEVSRLRTQISREMLSKKANSPKLPKKSKFDPSKAFQHAGKENNRTKPLVELKDNDLNTTTTW